MKGELEAKELRWLRGCGTLRAAAEHMVMVRFGQFARPRPVLAAGDGFDLCIQLCNHRNWWNRKTYPVEVQLACFPSVI